MIIKSLRLKNIRSYIDETITFPEGSCMLSGDVGSGKSSILMAILFALFSPIPQEVSGNALLRHGATSGLIELEIEVNERRIKICRKLGRAKKGKKLDIKQGNGTVEIEGVESDYSPEGIKAFVLGELGYPQEFLKKKYIDIFQFTVYTPQERIKEIITTEVENRKNILNAVFDIDKYKNVKDGASETVTEINRKVKELNATAKGLEDDRATKSGAEGELKDSRTLLSEVETHITEALKERDDIEKRLGEIRTEIEALAKLDGSLEEVLAAQQKSEKDHSDTVLKQGKILEVKQSDEANLSE